MSGKSFFGSKTILANLIMAGLAGLGAVPVTRTTALVALGLNVALRIVTGRPITSLLPGGDQ